MKTKYQIEGMTCNGCRTRIENALKELDADVTVTLEDQTVLISDAVNKQLVLKTVSDLGYTIISK